MDIFNGIVVSVRTNKMGWNTSYGEGFKCPRDYSLGGVFFQHFFYTQQYRWIVDFALQLKLKSNIPPRIPFLLCYFYFRPPLLVSWSSSFIPSLIFFVGGFCSLFHSLHHRHCEYLSPHFTLFFVAQGNPYDHMDW